MIRISIDDGDVLDLKSAELLEKYELINETTLYVAPYYRENKEECWKVHDITKQLSDKGFNVGGHTFSHSVIRYESYSKKIEEINSGKEFLEELIGKKITSFAYPKGYYDEECKRAVKTCGFIEARTMKTGVTDIDEYDPFELPITIHFYPERYNEFLDKLNDKYFHLAFHSWEIEKFGLWEELEKHLKILNEYKNKLIKQK